MKRTNNLLETFKSLKETKQRLAEAEAAKINEKVALRESFKDKYYIIKEMKAKEEARRSTLMEAARNDAFGTVLKAIYITALEGEALTDDGLLLAESMVDNWIKENGGASKILNKVGNNTYLLSRISQIVEDAAEAAVEEIESADDEATVDTETQEKDALDAAKDFIDNADSDEVKDFVSKIVDNIQQNAEDKAKEEIEKAEEDIDKAEEDAADAEKEIEKAEDDEAASVTTDTEEEAPVSDETEEVEKDTDKAEDEAKEDIDKAEEDTADAEKEIEKAEDDTKEVESDEAKEDTADAETADQDSKVEDVPAEDNDVKPTDTENETPDTDPDIDSDDALNDSDDEDIPDTSEEIDIKTTDVDPEESPNNDEDVKDALGEPLDDDGVDSDITIDGDTENSGEILDDLDKEEDVQKAIELIKTRVADAEETFIRNNAEDKKKMDEIISKISANVKTIEDINNSEDTDSKVAKESVLLNKRRMDAIRENRPLTIFEKMTRNLASNIVKDSTVMESYTIDGKLDTELVVEAAKVMYGFLETINTIQLAKVDEKYIAKVLDGMK